jgi:hypothetical protein
VKEHKPNLATEPYFEPQILTTERVGLERHVAHAHCCVLVRYHVFVVVAKSRKRTQHFARTDPPVEEVKVVQNFCAHNDVCRERRGNYSAEEDAILKDAKEDNLNATWSEIAALMNRTVSSVSNRWRLLSCSLSPSITYCTCQKESEEGELMIECSEGGKCNGWVHPGCCGLSDTDVDNLTDVDYTCPGCVSTQQQHTTTT